MNHTKAKGALLALLALTGSAFAADYSSWAKYRNVTVSTTGMGLGGAVTNVPLLVRFNATDHADMLNGAGQIQANGSDVRVTKADGTTDVPFEIESAATGANGHLVIWIKADNVAQNSATAASFRIFWGKTGQTSLSAPAAVFDTAAGFAAVWHMNQPTAVAKDSLLDATVNKNTAKLGLAGTTTAPVDSMSGLGVGKHFASGTTTSDGAFFYVKDSATTALNMNTNNGPYTLSAWVKPTACGTGNNRLAVISKYDNNNAAGTRAFALQTASNNPDWRMTNDPSSFAGTFKANNEFTADTLCTPNVWQYVVGTYSLGGTVDTTAASAQGAKISLNGSPYKLGVRANQGDSNSLGSNAPVFIGRMNGTVGNNIRFFRGSMDEVRVHKVSRSADWNKLEYETQRPTGGTAVTVSATQENITGPYANYTGHRDIPLNTTATGAKVTGLVTNFPVLIRLNSSITEENTIIGAANGGNSIRFSKEDDATALPYQIESWTSTGAAIWVKVDSIKGGNSTQKIRMHWGNGSATSESNAAAVFPPAEYHAVWHMSETTGNLVDATGNGNAAAPSTTAPTTPTTSLIGGGKTFNGSTNWYTIGADSTALNLNTDVGPYTLSAWVKPTSCDARIAAISKYSNNDEMGRNFALHTANTTTTWRFTNGAPAMGAAATPAEFVADAPEACVAGSWSYVVGTYRQGGAPTADSAVNAKIYVNGALVTSGTTSNVAAAGLTAKASRAYIGRISTDERFMNGDLDEIRVSKVARDSNWVRLSYENQKAQNSLVNIGNLPLTAPAAPTGVTGIAGAKGTASITVSWTAPTNNGGSIITGYKAMTLSPDTTKSCTTTGALTCVINGLTAGGSYTFQVRAINAIGSSSASAASGTVTAPVSINGNSLLISVGSFSRPYTFVLPQASALTTEKLSMSITDVYGRNVWSKTLTNTEAKKGEINWNGLSSNGQKVGTGVYIVRVKVVGEGMTKEINQMGVKLRN